MSSGWDLLSVLFSSETPARPTGRADGFLEVSGHEVEAGDSTSRFVFLNMLSYNKAPSSFPFLPFSCALVKELLSLLYFYPTLFNSLKFCFVRVHRDSVCSIINFVSSEESSPSNSQRLLFCLSLRHSGVFRRSAPQTVFIT